MVKEKSAISIIEGLIKGTTTITRMADFRKILAEYPNNPFVNRLVADFLKKGTSFQNAIKRYKRTYGLFMAEGETLHAIAALMELWEIVTPAPHDIRALYSQLRRRDTHNSALDECFAAMSYQELRATLSRASKIRVKAEEIVQRPGDPEEVLYFVISGELVKTPTKDENENYAVVQFLIANDHFGDDYPCEMKKPAPYQVKAVSESELLKISKEDFLSLCRNHPNLEEGFSKLTEIEHLPEAVKPEKFFRKSSRRYQALPLILEIFYPEPGRQSTTIKGFSSDISLGGTCVVVDPKYREILGDDIMNRKTILRVSLPDEAISVLIVGSIIWLKDTRINGQQTFAIGIQFNDTPPRLRAAMIFFVTALSSLNKDTTEYTLSQDEIDSL